MIFLSISLVLTIPEFPFDLPDKQNELTNQVLTYPFFKQIREHLLWHQANWLLIIINPTSQQWASPGTLKSALSAAGSRLSRINALAN
jgi:hypothetical protein